MEAKKLRTVQGKPLTRAGMLQEIADAEEEYQNGNYTFTRTVERRD